MALGRDRIDGVAVRHRKAEMAEIAFILILPAAARQQHEDEIILAPRLRHPDNPASLIVEPFMYEFKTAELAIKGKARLGVPHMQRDMSEIDSHHISVMRPNRIANQSKIFAIMISLTKLPSTRIESRLVPSST